MLEIIENDLKKEGKVEVRRMSCGLMLLLESRQFR